MSNFKIRCSSLADLMTEPRSKSEKLSETAKSIIKADLIASAYGRVELNTKEIRKGRMMEEEAIRAVGLVTASMPQKNIVRVSNDWITGECDFLNDDRIDDTKCSWSIDTFPFFMEDAIKAVKKAGYDWQGQGYMWLYDRPVHYVHYVLLPTPSELLGFNDDPDFHIDAVERIPLKKRVKTVEIKRDESLHERIIEKVMFAREYADKLMQEM